MPRYFFHIHNDTETIDEEGQVLADAEAARMRAVDEARNLAAESVKSHGHLVLDHNIRVTDETGAIVITVPFENAVQIGYDGDH